jgi:predicted Fe-Mo cluster-binding NifX family protein
VKKMRICVPTDTDEGTGAAVSRHFGRAPYFSVVDSITGEVEVVANRHLDQAHGDWDPVSQLSDLEPDAVVVAGIGGTALGRLAAAGIPTFLTSASTLGHVLSQVRGGGLKEIDPKEASRGSAGPGHGRIHRA